MGSIHPREQDLAELTSRFAADSPVVMLNLLRFHDQARYPEGTEHEPCTGRQAYARYSGVAGAKLAEIGGSVVYAGAARAGLIGPDDESWDQVLLVRYPSAEAFLRMVAKPDYQAAAVHRTAALADSRLVATDQG